MAPRDLTTLKRDGETIDTIVSALADLERLRPTTDAWKDKIAALKRDLLAERETILNENQGSLF